MSQVPIDFVTPSARMKLAHRPAVSASVIRRPSRKPSTSPNTIPSDSPLRKSQRGRMGRGETPKSSNASSAAPTRMRIPTARRLAGVAAMTRMPRIFDSVYPSTWAVTSSVFSSIPHTAAPENAAAVNGLRKAYMQKYVPNAAESDQAASAMGDGAAIASVGFVSGGANITHKCRCHTCLHRGIVC